MRTPHEALADAADVLAVTIQLEHRLLAGTAASEAPTRIRRRPGDGRGHRVPHLVVDYEAGMTYLHLQPDTHVVGRTETIECDQINVDWSQDGILLGVEFSGIAGTKLELAP